MEKKYWLNRWDQGNIGWHQKEAEPALVSFFSQLKPTRVFVPLCGKSLDLLWLAQQGHHVLGVELSERACRAFFEENGLAMQLISSPHFTLYHGDKITIMNGDFFSLSPSDLGELGAVYDRAALIALPPEVRKEYSQHMIKLVRGRKPLGDFKYLQVTLNRTPHDEGGPPFSVSEEEIRSLYQRDFEITLLGRELESSTASSTTYESVYSLKIKYS